MRGRLCPRHARRYSRGDTWAGLAAATITTTITPIRAIYRRARQLGEVTAVHQFRNGRIVRDRLYLDRADALETVGLRE